HRTGDAWCIYPMYDYAHPLEDAFEGVTHSICTLEFESNRELYDWVLDNLGPWDPRPRQYEFARLALGYTVMSKRKLLQLVNDGRVSGWDDPRMPTIAGMRRRGVTPEALQDFAELIGVAKNNSVVDIGKLEFAIRGDLEKRSPRALAVLSPLRLVVTSWPAEKVAELDVPWWPGEPARGSRRVPFGRELLVEREDFALEPPKDWKRLAPGREVRLAGAYVVRCDEVVRGPSGEIAELRCTHDPASLGDPAASRRAAGTIHWVHATRSVPAEVRLYDRLFRVEMPDAEADFLEALNPDSLAVAPGARIEPALAAAEPASRWQFLRQGYFFADPVDSRPGKPVFNRTITLKDAWAAKAASAAKPAAERRPRDRKAAGEPAAPRKTRAEFRAEAREESPELETRYRLYTKEHGLSQDEADLLTGDVATAAYFDAGVDAGAKPASAARWLLNDLAGLAGDRALTALPLSGADFGRFVALVDAGRVTPNAAKALLADLARNGGDPAARAKALGLEKVEDRGALDAAVLRALSARKAEADRYRAGEKKLLGVLLGAVMRETGGAADPAIVRKMIEEKLR
ncbi:MAG TPA: glutamine--tRNA ligase/YqeY domain fusion protein, partial [Anaeromyxobacter sp.]|nr:glutamine--tRNA ligase/YqeY domain fusion protein [Anaeromyxobacter sp.]